MASLCMFLRSYRRVPGTEVGGALVYSRASAGPGLTGPGRTSGLSCLCVLRCVSSRLLS